MKTSDFSLEIFLQFYKCFLHHCMISFHQQVEEMEVALDFCKELYELCDEYNVLVPEQDSEDYYVSTTLYSAPYTCF